MRLIDADALLKQIDIDSVKIGPGQYGDEWRFMGTIVNAPTIDPVQHGYWKETDDPMFRACSVCGYLEWRGLWNNYCPECGAKMERPCDKCQEWDCYGCDYKQTERSE